MTFGDKSSAPRLLDFRAVFKSVVARLSQKSQVLWGVAATTDMLNIFSRWSAFRAARAQGSLFALSSATRPSQQSRSVVGNQKRDHDDGHDAEQSPAPQGAYSTRQRIRRLGASGL